MIKKHTICNLALSISGALLLSACGGGSSGSASSDSTQNAYSYSNLTQCADTDTDGVCSAFEKQIAFSGNYPRMVNDNGAILTAHKDAELVSPFTTLVYNEVLFNPMLKGNPTSAANYLQSVLGDKLGVNFLNAATTHGPKKQTETLLKSLRQAQTQGQHDPITNIAHAVDVMIENQTLDLSGFDLRKVPNRHVSFAGKLVVHGSQTDSALTGAKSIAFNPANNKIVYVDSANNTRQISINNTNRALLSSRSDITAYDSHSSASEDDDDDDDDDNNYNWQTFLQLLEKYGQGNAAASAASRFKQIVPALNSVQAYKLYQPQSGKKASSSCDNKSGSGVFLASLYDKKSRSTTTSRGSVDAYAGASGSTPLPLPKPKPQPIVVKDKSAKGCFNDNFNWIMPLYQQKSLLTELDADNSSSTNNQLRKLNAESLAIESESYILPKQNAVMASFDESELLVIDTGGSENAALLSSKSLRVKQRIGVTNASTAAFALNNELVFGLKSSKLVWVEKNAAATELKPLVVDGEIKQLKSSPNGKFAIAITPSSLYILDNSTRSLVKKVPIAGNEVKQLTVLNNKAIAVKNSGLDYVQFSNLSGPKLKVAAQLMTNSLKESWATTSGVSWNTSNFGYILEKTGVDAQIANQFDNINVTWLPIGVTDKTKVTGANISGLDRGHWITLYKSM